MCDGTRFTNCRFARKFANSVAEQPLAQVCRSAELRFLGVSMGVTVDGVTYIVGKSYRSALTLYLDAANYPKWRCMFTLKQRESDRSMSLRVQANSGARVTRRVHHARDLPE